MTYRIIMNGNGKFKIERKRGWIAGWFVLGQYKNNEPYFGNWNEDALLFNSSEAACKALLEAQERDARERREEQWSVVVEEKL